MHFEKLLFHSNFNKFASKFENSKDESLGNKPLVKIEYFHPHNILLKSMIKVLGSNPEWSVIDLTFHDNIFLLPLLKWNKSL